MWCQGGKPGWPNKEGIPSPLPQTTPRGKPAARHRRRRGPVLLPLLLSEGINIG